MIHSNWIFFYIVSLLCKCMYIVECTMYSYMCAIIWKMSWNCRELYARKNSMLFYFFDNIENSLQVKHIVHCKYTNVSLSIYVCVYVWVAMVQGGGRTIVSKSVKTVCDRSRICEYWMVLAMATIRCSKRRIIIHENIFRGLEIWEIMKCWDHPDTHSCRMSIWKSFPIVRVNSSVVFGGGGVFALCWIKGRLECKHEMSFVVLLNYILIFIVFGLCVNAVQKNSQEMKVSQQENVNYENKKNNTTHTKLNKHRYRARQLQQQKTDKKLFINTSADIYSLMFQQHERTMFWEWLDFRKICHENFCEKNTIQSCNFLWTISQQQQKNGMECDAEKLHRSTECSCSENFFQSFAKLVAAYNTAQDLLSISVLCAAACIHLSRFAANSLET